MSKIKPVLLVGPFSQDVICRPGVSDFNSLGGTVYYTGHALQALSVPYSILTSLSSSTQSRLKDDSFHPLSVLLYGSEDHSFTHTYRAGLAERVETVNQGDTAINLQNLNLDDYSWIHLGGLLASDYEYLDMEFLKRALELGIPVSLDAQGLLRTIEGGAVQFELASRARSLLSLVTVFKMNEDEAGFLRSKISYEDLFRLGVEDIIVTRGGDGASLLRGTGAFGVEGIKVSCVDTTGCGDSFMAGYIAARLKGKPPRLVLELANFLGAECAKTQGPLVRV